MVTKPAEEVKTPQTEVVIEAEEKVAQKTQAVLEALTAQMKQKSEAYVKRMASAEIAGPIYPYGYQYWNCLTYGPYQTIFNPPYLPNKIIAAGDPCTFWSLIWINPIAPPGAGLPPSVVLGGRPYTVRFETVDLTAVAKGPAYTYASTFASPAPEFTWVQWDMPTPDPGGTPHLYEMNVTMDVTLSGQPFAGFSTWHFDPDMEPAFLGMPQANPEWQFERPARFLLYHL